MNMLKSVTINEIVKLWAQKKTRFFLALILLLPFLGLPVVLKLQSGFGITGVNGAQYPITLLNGLTLFLMPLLIFMTASDTFSGEFGTRTIRAILVRPVSRWKIYSAKLFALFALIGAGLLLGWLSATAASFFLPTAAGGQGSGIAESAVAYAAAAWPLFVLAAAAVLLAQGFKNATGALAVGVLLYAAAKLLAFILPQYAAFLPTAYTNWHQIWIGSAAAAGKIAAIFSFLLGCGIVFYASGIYLFEKKEV